MSSTPPDPRFVPSPAVPRAVLLALLAAVGASVVATPTWAALGTALVLALPVAAGLLHADPPIRGRTRVLLVATAVPLVVLPLRTGPESILLVAVCWAGLLALAITTDRGVPPWALGPVAGLQRLAEAAVHLVRAPAWVGPLTGGAVRGRARGLRAVLRGLLVAVPLVWVLAALLASADQVFASTVSLRLPDGLGLRLTVAIGTAWTCLAVGRGLASEPVPTPDPVRRWLGTTEVVTVLLPVVAVFALFTTTQVVAALGGADHVLAQAGLTYATYAREGFFQLVAVAVITLGVLVSIAVSVRHRTDGRPARAVRWLGLAAIALVLVVVGVALRRLDLYAEAYGLTRLRVWATIGTIGIGGTFLLLGVRWAGVRRGTAWLLPAVVAWAVVLSTTAMAVGPDAVIARANIALALAGEEPLDVGTIGRLSDDAVPAVMAALPELEAVGALDICEGEPFPPNPDMAAPCTFGYEVLQAGWCDRPPAGWAAWNLARVRADAALEGFC